MSGSGDKLTPKQQAAIEALLAHPTVVAAANACGVGESTIRRWLKQPEFAMEYREARRQAFSQANARVQQAMHAAVATLIRLLMDESAGIRLRAAETILAHAAKAVDQEDRDVRLVAIEQHIRQQGRAQEGRHPFRRRAS